MIVEVFINRVAAFLPNEPVANEEIDAVLKISDPFSKRIRNVVLRSNGIKKRHYVLKRDGTISHNGAKLAAAAIKALFEKKPAELNQIETLAVATSVPDQLLPNHGVMVHGELGCPPLEVVNTTGVCMSGVTALKYAWLSVKSGDAKSAVASACETASLGLYGDRYAYSESDADMLAEQPQVAFDARFLRYMLSDGAGAMLLSNEPEPNSMNLRIDWIDVISQANQINACMYMGASKNSEDGTLLGWREQPISKILDDDVMCIKQDVKLLNETVVDFCITKALPKIAKNRNLSPQNIDWFLPHMSSEYFRNPMQKCLDDIGFPIPQERWFTNLSTTGNTGSASIYIMLNELIKSGKLSVGQRILCFVPESGRMSTSYFHLTVV